MSGSAKFRVASEGDEVTIDGLVTAVEHNGKKAKVLKWMHDKGRYKVKLLEETKLLSLKGFNLRHSDLSDSRVVR